MTCRRRTTQPRGFTLVELLIVITVLAILVGLLIPAVNSVRSKVRHAAVQTEINRLAAAVTAFKTQYGVEPPSYIELEETGGTNGANWDARSRALIRQMWPQFDFSMNRDINGDGTINTAANPIRIDASEALVFFLGGLPVPTASGSTTNFSLVGFATNPQNPFVSGTATANRAKSFYDFETGRLRDSNGNGVPEFFDSYPGQQNAVIYFSSYDATSYRLADFPGNWPAYASSPSNSDKTQPIHWYIQGPNANSPAFNAKSFQIISPGVDGQYGPGGPYLAGEATPLPAWTRAGQTPTQLNVTVNVEDRVTERDNITNFGNGQLVP